MGNPFFPELHKTREYFVKQALARSLLMTKLWLGIHHTQKRYLTALQLVIFITRQPRIKEYRYMYGKCWCIRKVLITQTLHLYLCIWHIKVNLLILSGYIITSVSTSVLPATTGVIIDSLVVVVCHNFSQKYTHVFFFTLSGDDSARCVSKPENKNNRAYFMLKWVYLYVLPTNASKVWISWHSGPNQPQHKSQSRVSQGSKELGSFTSISRKLVLFSGFLGLYLNNFALPIVCSSLAFCCFFLSSHCFIRCSVYISTPYFFLCFAFYLNHFLLHKCILRTWISGINNSYIKIST